MTTKTVKSRNTGSSKNSGDNRNLPDFVSCELSDEQKKHVKAHLPAMDQALDSVDRFVRDGYKLSIRFEDRSMAYAVWLTGPEKDSTNSGLVLSARGPSLVAALGVLLYKHFEVLQEDWTSADVQLSKRDSWG